MRPFIFIALLACAACDGQIMATSGKSFMAGGITPENIAKAAAYEPDLSFPARVGVVRLVSGRVAVTPQEERTLFKATVPDEMGEIVELGPLEARMASLRGRWADAETLRTLAASRHLDYVLILDLDTRTNTAEAAFLDVRSGYPYGSVETRLEGRVATNFWGGPVRNQNRIDRITLRLAKALEPGLKEMLAKLVDAQA